LRQTDLKEMYFTYKMATIEQLEKQKQDLISSYNQILKDTTIPSSDRVQIIKDLSRAIANITDQINKQAPAKRDEREEVIKEIKKEKKALQPKTIPRSAEEGRWKLDEIVRVVRLYLDQLPEVEHEEDGSIQWDKFKEVVIPKLVELIRDKMKDTAMNFPIVLQTSIRAICNRLGPEEATFYKNYRTRSMSNINHVANNFEQLEKILREHLNEIIEETETTEGDSQTGVVSVSDYHVRFWEYKPSIVRKVNSVYAKGNGYIETPE
jgi:hypothetical protein